MKFHKQTKLYKPEEGKGNCYPTVLACLLDLELDQVPNFETLYFTSSEEQNISDYFMYNYKEGTLPIPSPLVLWDKVREMWLASKGFKEHYIEDIEEWLQDNKDVPYTCTGISPRGVYHIVIYMNGKMIHDPHPEGGGVVPRDSYPFMHLKNIKL